jgi:hypothetical protein
MQQFKQNETTATYRRIYMFLANPADGYTPVTSLVGATVNLFKNGVAFGSQPTTPATLTHIQSGHWYYEMTATYLSDLGILTVTVQDTNIRPVVLMAQVVAYDPTASTGISAADVWTYGTRDLTGSVAVASIATNAITAASITDGVIASEVWGALLASYTTNNTFGQRVLRSTTSQAECAVTGSHHIAADIHELQPNVITAAGINAGAIDADALATDAVTEIVTAVWSRDPSVGFASGTSGYWLYEAGVNSQAIVSDTNTIAGTLYVESIADALLNRNVGGGSNSGRLVKEALYALRNKSEIVGALLSVYDADDNLSWTAAVASSASADPVTGIDP